MNDLLEIFSVGLLSSAHRTGESAGGSPSFDKYAINPIYEIESPCQFQLKYVFVFPVLEQIGSQRSHSGSVCNSFMLPQRHHRTSQFIQLLLRVCLINILNRNM